MICRFIGKTSMGFITGRVYTIRSDIKDVYVGGKIFGESIPCICIYDVNSSAWCPISEPGIIVKKLGIIDIRIVPT